MRHGEAYKRHKPTIEYQKSIGIKIAGVPKEWTDPPVLPSYLQWVQNAFNELSTQRQIGMGVGAIPVLDILEYAKMYLRLNDFDTEYFKWLIQQADSVYLAEIAARSEAKEKGK